jgi:hypothetical protein
MSQLAAEKKKTVMALCLIAVMVLMWLRVFGRKTPQSAEAALMTQRANLNILGSDSELKISFIELPKVEGRNDVLTGDFFAADGWQNFMSGGEVNVVLKDGSQEVVTRVAEKLKLEAIGLGENPQAFINNKLLSVGDKLLVRDGVNTCECEVVGIEESTVFIRCGEAEIKLKLTQASKTTY